MKTRSTPFRFRSGLLTTLAVGATMLCGAAFAQTGSNNSGTSGLDTPGPNGGRYGSPGGVESTVVCESQDYRRRECPVDTRGGVRLEKQESKAECVQGRTWGTTRSGIWVDRGCAARFRVAAGNDGRPSNDSMPDRLYSVCARAVAEREDFRRSDVSASNGRASGRRTYDIDVRTPRGRFVCNVERDGDVRDIRRR